VCSGYSDTAHYGFGLQGKINLANHKKYALSLEPHDPL